MKPMLAAPVKIDQVQFPVYASAKLDGVRAVVMEGTVFARSLKELPNENIQKMFGQRSLEGLDGELVFGPPYAKDVYLRTVSICNSKAKPIPDIAFWVFDFITEPDVPFSDRLRSVNLVCRQAQKQKLPVYMLPQVRINNEKELREYERYRLVEGYEGVILRSPDGTYKYGRSTVKEGGMLKLKRFVDAEAEILEVYEEFANENEATTNALGRTERSSAKAGLVAKGTAGGLHVRSKEFTETFRIGTGFTAEQREWFWANRSAVVGKQVKFKFFDHGVKDRPRHPVYLGPREDWDL